MGIVELDSRILKFLTLVQTSVGLVLLNGIRVNN